MNEILTVAELIALLSKCNPDATVGFSEDTAILRVEGLVTGTVEGEDSERISMVLLVGSSGVGDEDTWEPDDGGITGEE